MTITEYQFCNTKKWEAHECNTDSRCNTPVREYDLPDSQRAAWEDFFSWLKADGVIRDFKIQI